MRWGQASRIYKRATELLSRPSRVVSSEHIRLLRKSLLIQILFEAVKYANLADIIYAMMSCHPQRLLLVVPLPATWVLRPDFALRDRCADLACDSASLARIYATSYQM